MSRTADSTVAFSTLGDDLLETRTHGSSAEHTSTTFALRKPASWCTERISRVEQLAELPENWDSYGANGVALHSIDWARNLIAVLSRINNVPAPLVSASPDGNVALSWNWNNDRRDLDVEVLPNGRLRYCYMDSEDKSSDREGTTSDITVIAGILTAW